MGVQSDRLEKVDSRSCYQGEAHRRDSCTGFAELSRPSKRGQSENGCCQQRCSASELKGKAGEQHLYEEKAGSANHQHNEPVDWNGGWPAQRAGITAVHGCLP